VHAFSSNCCNILHCDKISTCGVCRKGLLCTTKRFSFGSMVSGLRSFALKHDTRPMVCRLLHFATAVKSVTATHSHSTSSPSCKQCSSPDKCVKFRHSVSRSRTRPSPSPANTCNAGCPIASPLNSARFMTNLAGFACFQPLKWVTGWAKLMGIRTSRRLVQLDRNCRAE